MDLSRLTALQAYIHRALSDGVSDPEERAFAENFMWDERPPTAGIDLYHQFLEGSAVSDLDEWTERHRNYTSVNISIDTGEPDLPWTFRPENDENRVDAVDPRINLIRVEEANWPRGIAGVSFEDLRRQVEAFQQSNNAAEIWLQRFVDLWNPERDKRPLFATTEMEVEDILQSDNPDWSERLRDRLG